MRNAAFAGRPGIRRTVRIASAAAAGAAILLGSAPAWSAKVIDIRVGRHADFTRIVFELDAPAGYKIERSEPAPGIAEVVVSLEAGSDAKKVATGRSLIERVAVEPIGATRSRARIRLNGDGLRLKEMILANPPRIVLDVLAPTPPVVAKRKPAPAAKPKPKAVERPVAKTPTPAPAPKVAKKAPPTPAPEPVIAEAPEPEVEETTPAARDAVSDGGDPGEPSGAGMLAEVDDRAADAVKTAMATPDEAPAAAVSEPAVEAAEATPAAKERSPAATVVPRTTPASEATAENSLLSTRNLSLVGGGILAIGLVLLFMRRRRSGDDSGATDEADGLGEDNPFAEFGAAASTSAEAETVEFGAEPEGDSVATTAELFSETEPDADIEVSSEPELFDEKPDEGVEMETATTGFEAPAMNAPPVVAGAGDEVMRLVRELERRVASLETRLDDVVNTKETLERQVAAQNEELRVQRAAIARTQRAVRNLSRPEEEGVTEPAPREG